MYDEDEEYLFEEYQELELLIKNRLKNQR